MLNLDGFDLKTMYRFQALLNEFVSTGGTDVRLVQTTVQNHIGSRRKTSISKMRRDIITEKKNRILCPSCGRGWLAPVYNTDGLNLMGCSECRHSEVVNVDTQRR